MNVVAYQLSPSAREGVEETMSAIGKTSTFRLKGEK